MDIDVSALKALVREKDLSLDLVVETIEQALLVAYHRTEGAAQRARATLDRKSGHVTVWRPRCGCGATRIRVACGPKRSKKHQAPTIGNSRCGNDRYTDIARTPPSGTSRASSRSARGPSHSAAEASSSSGASSRVICDQSSSREVRVSVTLPSSVGT